MSNFDDVDWDSDDLDDDNIDVATPADVNDDDETPFRAVILPPETVSLTDSAIIDSSNHNGIPNVISVAATGEGEHMTVIQLDSNGEEVATVIDLALPPLEREEALEITERIKGTTNVLYLLIKRAHAGKAYKALGYSSFEAYVREEFDYSRSYAYKLLNQATVIEAIEAVVPEGTQVYVGELTARGLKSSLPELIETIEERTANAGDAADYDGIIQDAIREQQENKRQENENYGDEDFDNDFSGDSFTAPSDSFEYIDDEDDTLNEFLDGDDPSLVVFRLERLYKLMGSLQNIEDLSEGSDTDSLLEIIPVDHRTKIKPLIQNSLTWLTELETKWDDFLIDNPVSNKEEEIEENYDADDDDIEY